MMDLVERIETTRFLGSEFLIWLWFSSEVLEGQFSLNEAGAVELWLDSQLLLQSASDKAERTLLKGLAPSGSGEAKLALLSGKLPSRARVCLTREQQDFTFVFDAQPFALGAVALPAVLSEAEGEEFFERMMLLERLEDLVRELYQEFLALRLSPLWQAEFEAALLNWARGKETLSARAYRGLMQRAQR